MLRFELLPEYNTPEWLSLNDFEGEEWRDIPLYEGLYSISNYGRVKSHPRKCNLRNGCYLSKERILKYKKARQYDCVCLCDGKSEKYMRVGRLVCIAFLPNPNNFPAVNHKDCNVHNNCLSNLEWCSYKYNNNYADHNKKLSETRKKLFTENPELREMTKIIAKEVCNRKEHKDRQRQSQMRNSNCIPIAQYTKEMKFISFYMSAKEAERITGIKAQNIRLAINHPEIVKSIGGFLWKNIFT